MITKVQGLVLLDFKLTPTTDVDGYWGIGVVLRDQVRAHFAAYFFLRDDAVAFLVGLTHLGVEYEIRDESLVIPAPGGATHHEQVREFIRPLDHGPFVPVAKRVELVDHDDFRARAIPARTDS